MRSFDIRSSSTSAIDLRQEFEEKGVILLHNVYPKKLCDEAINCILEFEKNIAEHCNKPGLVTERINSLNYIKYLQGLCGINKLFYRFLSYSILNVCAQIMDMNDLYFSDMETHIRNPGGSDIPKHQDNFYFNLKRALGMTCYVALNDQNSTSGSLNYLLYSHINRVINHSQSSTAGFSSFIQENDIIYSRLKVIKDSPTYYAGSVTIHHPENIHFANKTPTTSNRGYALSIRVFSQSESIDEDGVKRYQQLLNQNRQ